MSSLANLKLGTDVKDDDRDSLGGNYTLESGLYPMIIDLAYMGLSQGGAASLNLVFKEGQQTLKQTLWVQSGNAKGNKPTYTDKQSGEERPLPGMSQANAICQLTMNKDLGDLDTEEKLIKLYNIDAKAEIDTKVEMVMDLIGHEIVLGVHKNIVDKNVKNDNGVYVPSGDTRLENEVDKIFQANTKLTVSERKAGLTEGEFVHKWVDKWTDVTQDKSVGAKNAGSTSGVPGKGTTSTTQPLFPAA